MERLDTRAIQPNGALESAVHLARYEVALSHCRGKRVLDVSCGEGYGSKLLRSAGALSVHGVDNAELAIARAREEYGGDAITFHCAEAEKLDELFAPGTFDLIVCLETIEHVRDPLGLLRSIKRVACQDAIIIISCPNDHWYYPTDATFNPYHVRKYSFEEYRTMTSQILGPGAQWLLGTAMLGFGTVPIDAQQRTAWQGLSPGSWLQYRAQQTALAVPGMSDDPLGPSNCSYFVGIWGQTPTRDQLSSATFPISMDRYSVCANAMFDGPGSVKQLSARLEEANERLISQQAELVELNSRLSRTEREAHKFRLQAAALSLETEIMGASVNELTTERDSLLRERDQLVMECDQLRIPAQRYIWLATKLRWAAPPRARPLLRRLARRLFT